MTETGASERAESIESLTWTLEGALNRAEEAAQAQETSRTFPAEWEVLELVAKDLRTVKAHKELRDAILAEPHDYNPGDAWYSCAQAVNPDADPGDDAPGSGCLDEDRAGGPCDCGRDARVERLLKIMAGIYEEPTQ